MRARIRFRKRPNLAQERKARRTGYRVVAGVDESGAGPLAGPLVAAAVILDRHRFKNRIDDSKRLTPKARLRAFDEISEHSVYNVSVIDRGVIDAVNIYNARKLAMEKAVIGLSVRPDFILVDGRIRLSLPCDSISIIRGDSISLSIACASVVAKVWRDRLMERLHEIYPEYGFKKNKGYGTSEHLENLKRYGPSPMHRLSFRPVKG